MFHGSACFIHGIRATPLLYSFCIIIYIKQLTRSAAWSPLFGSLRAISDAMQLVRRDITPTDLTQGAAAAAATEGSTLTHQVLLAAVADIQRDSRLQVFLVPGASAWWEKMRSSSSQIRPPAQGAHNIAHMHKQIPGTGLLYLPNHLYKCGQMTCPVGGVIERSYMQ